MSSTLATLTLSVTDQVGAAGTLISLSFTLGFTSGNELMKLIV
jgi:hypothetical protein